MDGLSDEIGVMRQKLENLNQGSMESGFQSLNDNFSSSQNLADIVSNCQRETQQQLAAVLHSQEQITIQLDIRSDMFEEVAKRVDEMKIALSSQRQEPNQTVQTSSIGGHPDNIDSLKSEITRLFGKLGKMDMKIEDLETVTKTKTNEIVFAVQGVDRKMTTVATLQEDIHPVAVKLELEQNRKEKEEKTFNGLLAGQFSWCKSRVNLMDGKVKTAKGKEFGLNEFNETMKNYPWIIFPEEYEIECSNPCCRKQISVSAFILDDKNCVKCPHCETDKQVFISVLGPPKVGFEWAVFRPCNHRQLLLKGERPKHCLFCGKEAKECSGDLPFKTPTRR